MRKILLVFMGFVVSLLLLTTNGQAGYVITQLTDNDYVDTSADINDNGYIVWAGHDGHDLEIFLYNGSTITQITDNEYDELELEANDNGYIVWSRTDQTVENNNTNFLIFYTFIQYYKYHVINTVSFTKT